MNDIEGVVWYILIHHNPKRILITKAMGIDHRRESKRHSKNKKKLGSKNMYMRLLVKVNVNIEV